jgi:hypothetical protein
LLGDVVGDQVLEVVALVEVDHPVEGVVVDEDRLLASDGHRPAGSHVINLSEALENFLHLQELLRFVALLSFGDLPFGVVHVSVEEELVEVVLFLEVQIVESEGEGVFGVVDAEGFLEMVGPGADGLVVAVDAGAVPNFGGVQQYHSVSVGNARPLHVSQPFLLLVVVGGGPHLEHVLHETADDGDLEL